MKKQFTFFLLSTLFITSSFSASEKKPLKISKKSAGQIERILNQGKGERRSLLENSIADVLIEEEAVLKFSETLVDLCLNPSKYDFPEGSAERNCNKEELKIQVIGDLAFGVVEKHSEKADAIQIESSMNELLNSYIDKYRSVVKAFSQWN